ncbi:DinB family protein [Limnochorda pilosa]|uniref:DinB-like domain-containing protein n=1 Tax=Limnochorda pilosa TaxID=1555112 RepID=A0A0K2SH26_LIMPI|nr:DinB family protein [Limnochorda pilosa]BAS26418.1 hypothetical protein LIP_0561 [Limnochorda pilosa]
MITDVSRERLARSIVALLDEAFEGPKEKWSWFTDVDPNAGILGVLGSLSHEAASTRPGPDRSTIVAHAEHVRFSLSLANRAVRGENPYATANWKESWAVQSVDEAGWERLREALRQEYRALREAVESGDGWLEPEEALTGTLANVVHVGYHLGAIRQMARSLEGAGAR